MIAPLGNLKEEYLALTKGLALYHNSEREVIRVTGKDHLEVLHNILTQDIKSLKEGESAQAALLSAQGKILAYMKVYRLSDCVLLDVEKGQTITTIQNIEKYIITEDVLLENISDQYAHFSALGAKVIVEKDKSEEFIKEVLSKRGVLPVGNEAFEIYRIKSGIPRHTVDFDKTIILNETGLDPLASSETKGCFPGQEVVARINTYEGWTKKLKRIKFEGNQTPKTQDKIFLDEKEVGWITSACLIPGETHGFALGYLKKGSFDQKLVIKIEINDGSYLTGKTI